MFFKKNVKEEIAFKNRLNIVILNPEVKKNTKLVELLQQAITRLNRHESIQMVASNLSLRLKENFAENELPKIVVDLQLKLARYTAVGANGIITGIFNW